MSRLKELIDEQEIKGIPENNFAEIEFIHEDREKFSFFSFELNLNDKLFYVAKQKKFYKVSRKQDNGLGACSVCARKGYSIITERGDYKCKDFIFEINNRKYAQKNNCIINYDFEEVKLSKRTMLALLVSKEYVLVTGEYLL